MSTKNERKKKKAVDSKMATRRGIILISVLAVLILVINLITASYSWFSPGKTTGSGAEYQNVVNTRSERCSFETIQGRKTAAYSDDAAAEAGYQEGDGRYYYHDTVVYDTNNVDGTVDIQPNQTVYFRTDIVNEDHRYSSVVSLYTMNMPANVRVCVNNPSNSVREVYVEKNNYYIIRNAYVKVNIENDVDGPGLLTVEWSVTNTGSTPITGFDFSPVTGNETTGLYLMYN